MANIIESKKFIWSDASTNHNKWWEIILYDNNDVTTNWARVGYDHQSKTFPGVGKVFVEKKINEKLKKGYTPAKVVDNNPQNIVVDNLNEIAKSQILKDKTKNNAILNKLIDRLVKSNIHHITRSTRIEYDNTSELFTTPLGIVTPDAIIEARELLFEIYNLVSKQTFNNRLNNLASKYLRLIPQNIGMKFDVKRIFPDIDVIQKQQDILDSLDASFKSYVKNDHKNVIKEKKLMVEDIFKVDLDILNDKKEVNRLVEWYESSKKARHGYNDIKIQNIYTIKIHDMDKNFLLNDPNKMEVFHGTSMANTLSILRMGLKIRPPSTAKIAGALFDNGVYGAIHSSKSLGYTFGKWGQSSGDTGFLFICDFAMGNIYETTEYGCNAPTKHDSIWAKASFGGLYHDELIVYNEKRVNIKYLLECK